MEEGESEGNIVEEDRMIAKEDTKRVRQSCGSTLGNCSFKIREAEKVDWVLWQRKSEREMTGG